MKKGSAIALVLALAVLASACSSSPAPIRVGAVYPLSGSQGPGGIDEYRGVRLAVGLVNADGGVDGRPVELEALDVPGADAAPGAIAALGDRGIRFVLGSYGSTVSEPAAAAAAHRHMLFWETGAVGSMPAPGSGGRFFFRVAPGGSVLGQAAVSFVADHLVPLWHRASSSLRFGGIGTTMKFADAVGLFASDKPDADAIDTSGLTPDARDLLERARSAYRSRYHEEMSAPALAGFSAAWALFHIVMPSASQLTPEAVAAQALAARIPPGGLPNGSGLAFSPPGATDPGANLLAATVIWEWLGVERRAVVWPRQFATAAIRPISIAP